MIDLKQGHMMKFTAIATIITIITKAAMPSIAEEVLEQSNTIPTSTPINSYSAAKGGDIALKTVFRIICPGGFGTGFLHKSGKVLTANHVVLNCPSPIGLLSDGSKILLSVLAVDPATDVALLSPSVPIPGDALPIKVDENLAIGAQVSTWGYPAGYPGLAPLLSVGYLYGKVALQTATGTIIQQWVVNAAFNSGNSGGPLLDVETGGVIGIVDSKLAPISPQAASALNALQSESSGVVYSATQADGKQMNVSEAQVVALMLNELRQQTQLVIGMAVLPSDLKKFLKAQNIDP